MEGDETSYRDSLDVLRSRISRTRSLLNDLESQLARREHEVDEMPTAWEQNDTEKMALGLEDYKRYGRQMVVPEIGLEGQENIMAASVLIVGVGGLGCPAAAYLAGAGVGRIGLVDGDTVELSNLHRQILHTSERVGMSKVNSAIASLKSLNPNPSYHAYCEHLTPANALDLLNQYEYVLDCTDHPTSRYLISDAAVLSGTILITASALQTEGQLMVLNRPCNKRGIIPPSDHSDPWTDKGFCYRCVFPKPPPAESVKSCGEGGILGPVVGVMGVLMAVEALKIIMWPKLSRQDTPPPSLLLYSATDDTPFRTVRLKGRSANCIACSDSATITPESLTSGSLDYAAFCGVSTPANTLPPGLRISASDYHRIRNQADTQHLLIDVREKVQFNICHLPGSINVPFSDLNRDILACASEINTAAKVAQTATRRVPIIFICRFGNDSQSAVAKFEDWRNSQINGVDGETKDIVGGLAAWRREVDDSFPEY